MTKIAWIWVAGALFALASLVSSIVSYPAELRAQDILKCPLVACYRLTAPGSANINQPIFVLPPTALKTTRSGALDGLSRLGRTDNEQAHGLRLANLGSESVLIESVEFALDVNESNSSASRLDAKSFYASLKQETSSQIDLFRLIPRNTLITDGLQKSDTEIYLYSKFGGSAPLEDGTTAF